MEPRWTSQEAANFLRLAEQTINQWRWRGCGPPYLKINGAVRYDPEVVRTWAASQTQTSTSEGRPVAGR